MRAWLFGLIGFTAIALVPAALAGNLSFNDYWKQANQYRDKTIQEFPDFTMITCNKGLTYYYFTKPNHPAYPGVIIRTIYIENGATYVREDGHSFASDADQPAFKAWLAQFQRLDEQMKEYAAGKTN